MGTTRLRRWSAGSAALLLAATVAACGSDEEDAGGGTQATQTSAAAEPAEFCEASVDVEASFTDAPPIDETTPPAEAQAALEEFSAQVEPLLARAQDTAPEEISDDVDTAVGLIREVLTTGDMSKVESPEYAATDDAIDEYMLAECGFEQMEVTGVDHEYEGIPDTVPAGTVAVTLTNEGQEMHEIGIVRINDDVTMPIQELAALPPEQSQSMIEFTGAAWAPPGESDTVFVRMEPGRYGAACFVPQGTTHDTEGSGPPHMTLGMLAEFEAE